MPIYAYKCSACGFAKDALQKMSDAPLTVCPACGASAFQKQVTAAGFQLKGSGWYVTDFRDGGGKKAADKGSDTGAEKGTDGESATAAAPAGEGTAPKNGGEAPSVAPASPAAASPVAAPAPTSTPAAKSD